MIRAVFGVLMGAFVLMGLAGCSGLPLVGGPDVADPVSAKPGELESARAKAIAVPTEPYWSYRVAELQVAADSLDQAEAALHAALAAEARYVPALCLLSKLDFERGRHEAAIERLAWVESAPEAPEELRAALALHLAAAGEAKRAEPLLQGRATATVKAYVLLKSNDYAAAAAPARDAVEDEPESAVRQNNFGITRLQAGDPLAARQSFLAAHKLDPELPGPLYNLAVVEAFYFLNRDTGREWFERYRKLAAEDPDGLGVALAGESASREEENEP